MEIHQKKYNDMKHLIYFLAVLLALMVCYLCTELRDHPFNTPNMGDAYVMGCGYASRPLDQRKIDTCIKTGRIFTSTLDKVME